VEVVTLPSDLADAEACARVCERTRDVDVGFVVLAAGDGCQGELTSHTLADERRVAQLNVFATLELTHAFAERLQARRRGGLVIVSSLLAFQGAPSAANYAATKAYGLVLAESLHFELRRHGVDVLGLAPGPTTDASSRVDHRRFPARQWLTAAQVVDAALGALGRRASVVPGAINNLLLWAGGHSAREARSHLIGRVAATLTDEAGA
jgi:short-subunit dehydrogenase